MESGCCVLIFKKGPKMKGLGDISRVWVIVWYYFIVQFYFTYIITIWNLLVFRCRIEMVNLQCWSCLIWKWFLRNRCLIYRYTINSLGHWLFTCVRCKHWLCTFLFVKFRWNFTSVATQDHWLSICFLFQQIRTQVQIFCVTWCHSTATMFPIHVVLTQKSAASLTLKGCLEEESAVHGEFLLRLSQITTYRRGTAIHTSHRH